MLTSHSFYPKITLPTRLSNNHATLIDNYFCKLTETMLDTTLGILIKTFSDHQPYFILLNNIKHKTHKPKYIKLSKQDTESIEGFHQEILNSAKHLNLNNNYNMNPNINYNVLHEIIQQAKIKHIPEKLVKFNKYNHKMPRWITKGILRSNKYKDELYQKHRMTDPHSTEFDTQKVNLKTYNNILRKSIRLAKKTYYETIFLQFKDDFR